MVYFFQLFDSQMDKELLDMRLTKLETDSAKIDLKRQVEALNSLLDVKDARINDLESKVRTIITPQAPLITNNNNDDSPPPPDSV